MRHLELMPFADEHVADAGRLLAERHARHRQHQPLLSPRFEDPAVCADAVAEAWAAEDASGAVAAYDGRLVGYLLGAPKSAATWGENVWVDAAGHAADGAETARELFASAAQRWADEGRTAHYVLVPADDPDLAMGWFRLGFGHQQTHGIQPLMTSRPVVPANLTVRPPVRDDIPALARLDLELPRAHGAAPTFSAGPPSTYEQVVAEWEEDFENPDFANFVVEHEGMVVGSASGCSVEKSSSHRGPAGPDGGWLLGFAAVVPEARGLGAGRAVAEAVAWAAVERGASCVVTDWRETNLFSSRAWRGLGYRDTFWRLHRLLGR